MIQLVMRKVKDFHLVQFIQTLNFLDEVIVQIQSVELSEHVKALNFFYSIVVQVKHFQVNIKRNCFRNDSLETFVLQIQDLVELWL